MNKRNLKIEIEQEENGFRFSRKGGDTTDYLSILAEAFCAVSKSIGVPPKIAIETMFEKELEMDMAEYEEQNKDWRELAIKAIKGE